MLVEKKSRKGNSFSSDVFALFAFSVLTSFFLPFPFCHFIIHLKLPSLHLTLMPPLPPLPPPPPFLPPPPPLFSLQKHQSQLFSSSQLILFQRPPLSLSPYHSPSPSSVLPSSNCRSFVATHFVVYFRCYTTTTTIQSYPTTATITVILTALLLYTRKYARNLRPKLKFQHPP